VRRADLQRIRGGTMNTARIGLRILATLALTMIVAGGGIATAQAQQGSAQRNKVVIQVSDADPGKWNLALNNARNLQADLGAANVDIEIVAYGPGIGMLKIDSTVGGRIDEATAAGVKVVACEITMKGQKLARADMLNGIGYVPAGVVELMSRQQQGWAYIRP
jgi:intracellular sulfur oxidation DsrE/DsrF family protein